MEGKRGVTLVVAAAIAAALAVVAPAGACDGAWTLLDPAPTSAGLNAVAWGRGLFVAVGEGGAVLTSADGTSWVARPSGTSSTLYGVACGPSGFVAVGADGATVASPDGLTWTAAELPDAPPLLGVAWACSRFVAVGPGDRLFESGDGASWDAIPLDLGPEPANLEGVACGAGRFAVVGSVGDGVAIVASPDGLAWSRVGGGGRDWLKAVVWTGAAFVAVGGFNYAATGAMAMTSADGVQWDAATYLPNVELESVAASPGEVIAVGGGEVHASPDGKEWTLRWSGSANLFGVAVGAGRVVAVGMHGAVVVGACAPRPARRHLRPSGPR
ncbi:MAG TPA: hypothetical protein VLW17_05140 [Thermoanaerobaculaceae bacterium]|nr:hypothetical protein [Thermoanaerobaculaceae bacterium]